MLKLTSLPSATVVKMAPDGASAAAGDTAIQSGNAATAATVSQRICALCMLFPPQSVTAGVATGAASSALTSGMTGAPADRPHMLRFAPARDPLPPSAKRNVDGSVPKIVVIMGTSWEKEFGRNRPH